MNRNLHRRVEVCFPIEAAKLRQRVVEDLELYLEDNTNAWELLPDGTYQKVEADGGPRLAASAVGGKIRPLAILPGTFNSPPRYCYRPRA